MKPDITAATSRIVPQGRAILLQTRALGFRIGAGSTKDVRCLSIRITDVRLLHGRVKGDKRHALENSKERYVVGAFYSETAEESRQGWMDVCRLVRIGSIFWHPRLSQDQGQNRRPSIPKLVHGARKRDTQTACERRGKARNTQSRWGYGRGVVARAATQS
jgi:hypothetical protein